MSESKSNGATMAPEKGGPVGSGTVAGLMAFSDYLIDKGIGTPSAVTPLKSAARQVFETVEGTDDIEGIDVRSLDIDDYLDRFQVKAISSGRYKPESIAAYRKRFTRLVEYYLNYLTSGAVPKLGVRSTATARRRQSADDRRAVASAEPIVAAPHEAAADGPGMISYPFPLESGGLANLRLPVRLSRTDAERLSAFIRTLVFEPQKQLTAAADVDEES
jgi:hypothetical protein